MRLSEVLVRLENVAQSEDRQAVECTFGLGLEGHKINAEALRAAIDMLDRAATEALLK